MKSKWKTKIISYIWVLYPSRSYVLFNRVVFISPFCRNEVTPVSNSTFSPTCLTSRKTLTSQPTLPCLQVTCFNHVQRIRDLKDQKEWVAQSLPHSIHGTGIFYHINMNQNVGKYTKHEMVRVTTSRRRLWYSTRKPVFFRRISPCQKKPGFPKLGTKLGGYVE